MNVMKCMALNLFTFSSSTGSLILTSSGTLHMAERSNLDTGYYTCDASNVMGTTNESGFVYIYNSTSVGYHAKM